MTVIAMTCDPVATTRGEVVVLLCRNCAARARLHDGVWTHWDGRSECHVVAIRGGAPTCPTPGHCRCGEVRFAAARGLHSHGVPYLGERGR
jgi:hypothetical protein